ncbi:EpsG family protein [bacterium]|nr:EpsG family protein [bacterium]
MFSIIFALSLYVILLIVLGKYEKAKKNSILLLFLFAVIMSFSKDLGRDYNSYFYNYEINYYSMIFSIKECIWSLLFIVSKFFTLDFIYLMLFIKIMTVTFFYYGLKNLKLNDLSFTIAIICFIYVPAITFLNIVRQGLAITIFFYAYSFLHLKKRKKYILWSIVAFFIHSSIVIIFFVNLLINLKKTRINIMKFKYMLIILLFTLIFISVISLYDNDIIEILNFLNLSDYIDLSQLEISIKNLFSPIVIANSLLIMYFIYDETKTNNKTKDVHTICFIGMILNIFSTISYIFDRVGILFSFYNPYMFSLIANESYISNSKKHSVYMILIFYCVNFVLNVFVYGEANHLIYNFYF